MENIFFRHEMCKNSGGKYVEREKKSIYHFHRTRLCVFDVCIVFIFVFQFEPFFFRSVEMYETVEWWVHV